MVCFSLQLAVDRKQFRSAKWRTKKLGNVKNEMTHKVFFLTFAEELNTNKMGRIKKLEQNLVADLK